MTPAEIEVAARRKYNSDNDSFWTTDEIMGLIYEAELEMARESINIERTYTTTTVASQHSYSQPTNSISIKRIEYDGQKLERITFREDDTITNLQSDTTATGTPIYYYEWNSLIYLRPIPDSALELKIYSYDMPQAVESTTNLEVPVQFHRDLVNYVVKEMALKDQNTAIADRYQAMWDRALVKVKAWTRKRKRGDEFQVVKNADDSAGTILGTV